MSNFETGVENVGRAVDYVTLHDDLGSRSYEDVRKISFTIADVAARITRAIDLRDWVELQESIRLYMDEVEKFPDDLAELMRNAFNYMFLHLIKEWDLEEESFLDDPE